jgi:hypothetical protein
MRGEPEHVRAQKVDPVVLEAVELLVADDHFITALERKEAVKVPIVFVAGYMVISVMPFPNKQQLIAQPNAHRRVT